MFIVRCPKCKQSMKYMPVKAPSKKKCVYCGYNFTVFSGKVNRIVKKIT